MLFWKGVLISLSNSCETSNKLYSERSIILDMKKTKLPLLIGLTLLTSQQAQSAVAFGDISGTATAPGATFVNFVLVLMWVLKSGFI